MKQFYFLAGLPRSGSTVLSSILSQNQAFYVSPNSALVELLVNVRNHVRVTEQARAFMQPTQEKDVLLGIMEGMYQFTDAACVIDKSRAWPHPDNIELLTGLLPREPKFLITVRDLPAVLTSFVVLIEAHPETLSFVDQELIKKDLPLTTEHRCEFLFSPGGTVWEAWHTLKMAFDAGYSNLFHIVEYDDLTARPAEVLANMYRFLDMSPYKHDLAAIVNKTPEDDGVYNLPGMHSVRPVLAKKSKDPIRVLGEKLVAKYTAVPHFWRQHSATKATNRNPFKLGGMGV